jgi:hypothetical protein
VSSVWQRVATRTRTLFNDGLRGAGTPLSPGFYDELEELLVAGDVGPSLAGRITTVARLGHYLTTWRSAPRVGERAATAP